MALVNLLVELHINEGNAASFAAMFRREFIARSRTEADDHRGKLGQSGRS